MAEEYITRQEHEEFSKRLAETTRRHDKRLELLEDCVKQNAALTVSVEKLALNMENMVNEQKEQGERLKALEEIPAKKWNNVTDKVIGAIMGVLGTAIGAGILYLLTVTQ